MGRRVARLTFLNVQIPSFIKKERKKSIPARLAFSEVQIPPLYKRIMSSSLFFGLGLDTPLYKKIMSSMLFSATHTYAIGYRGGPKGRQIGVLERADTFFIKKERKNKKSPPGCSQKCRYPLYTRES